VTTSERAVAIVNAEAEHAKAEAAKLQLGDSYAFENFKSRMIDRVEILLRQIPEAPEEEKKIEPGLFDNSI